MFCFDMYTIVFTFLLVAYLCTALLCVTWQQNKQHIAGIRYFCFSYGLLASGLSFSIFVSVLPPVLTIVLPNCLFLASAVMILKGIATFINHRISVKSYLAYVIVFGVAYWYFAVPAPDVRMRIMLFSLAVSPVYLHTIQLVFRTADANHRHYARAVGIVVSLQFLHTLTRVYFAYQEANVSSYFNTPLVDSLLIIIAMMLILALTFSLQLMVNNKLRHMTEISRKEQTNLLSRLERMAACDPLTGAYNRRKLEEELQHALEYAKRYNQPLSICMCDIDHFKHINDTYGHDIGDQALIIMTELLNSDMRSADILSRWGGEEFLIVTPGLTLGQARSAAERLRVIISTSTTPQLPTTQRITASFGIAEFNGQESIDQLIKRADDALYRAKELGRNRVEQ